MNNHLSWLELSPQIPAPPSLLQETPLAVQCPLQRLAVLAGSQVVQWFLVSLHLHQQGRIKKVNEKVGKIPWMGKEILVLQFSRTKKGAFIYGTLLSVPYPSHLVKGTRRQQWHFLVAKVLIKKMNVLPKDCCSLYRQFHPHYLANVVHWTEHISFLVT